MTGFGRGTARVGSVEATAEVRTVNGRYADASVRLPHLLAARETTVQKQVKEAIGRGNASVTITANAANAGEIVNLEINRTAAATYGRLLQSLKEAAGLTGTAGQVQVSDLLQFQSDLFTLPEPDPDAASGQWEAAQAALDAALDRLDAMRLAEGRALHNDLATRADAIEAHVTAIEDRAPARVKRAQDVLRERLAALLDDDRFDPERLEQEAALLADKLDVTEECVRLRSHLDQFRAALDSDEPVGRRLNFLAQEFHREINTIGSKANDAEITRRAVLMKEELEKIREQVQNVV